MNTPKPIPFEGEGPLPLIREVPAPEPFPMAALGPLLTGVEAIAVLTEAPPALCAASVLGVAALAAQGLYDVKTLGGSSPMSLFLLTIAESGERKSTVDKLAMRGVRAFEDKLHKEYLENQKIWKRDHAIWERRKAAILKGADGDPVEARADLEALGPEPSPPIRPQITAGSATIEGIVKHLGDLRPSLGIMTDEGGLLLGGHSMKAENRLSTMATLASMWDGAPLDRWRAGDGISSYPGRRFSSHIMIQPKAAEDFLSDPLANGQGLLARFLTSRPASNIGNRLRFEDCPQERIEIDRLAEKIERLLSRELELVDGRRNELAPPILPLTPEARAVLVDFAREVERAQAVGGPFEDCRPVASKMAEQAVRIAGVLTVFEDPDANAVAGETMANSVTLATYYANEAARLHAASIVPEDVKEAEKMRKWLIGSWSEDYISAAIAAQRGPFKTTKQSRKALELLEKYDWLVPVPGAIVLGVARKEAWRVIR